MTAALFLVKRLLTMIFLFRLKRKFKIKERKQTKLKCSNNYVGHHLYDIIC